MYLGGIFHGQDTGTCAPNCFFAPERAAAEILAGAGRALNVCATGADLAEARERAYGAVALIDWPQGFHRTDIGWRALAR